MNKMMLIPIATLIISLLIFIHAILYPPQIVVSRIIENIIAAFIFIYSISKINSMISRGRNK